MQKEQPEALRLADVLDAMWIDPALCHHKVAPQVENAAAALRNLHTENTALRVTEDNLRQELQECQDQRRAAFRRIEELDAMRAQIGQDVPDVGQFINLLVNAAFRKGELWERCQGKFWPEAESNEFTKLRDKTIPDAIASFQQAIAYAPAAPKQKPLTDEQIQAMYDECDKKSDGGNEFMLMFVRAIEAAHGIGEKK